jgi:endothelin-converting enzyme/putative endopeptidase
LKGSKSKYKSDTDQGKAINLYKTILDTIGRNKLGITPLKPYLKKLMQLKQKDLQTLLIEMEPLEDWFLWSKIGPDAKNSNRNVISVGPGGVGLPDRVIMFLKMQIQKKKREKYALHVAKMLGFLGKNLPKLKYMQNRF